MLRKLSAAFFLLFTITLNILADDVTFTQDGVTYKIDSEDASALHVVYNADYSGCITIPDVVNYNGKNYFVNLINSQAFQNNKKVKCINLHGTNHMLGAQCFQDCSVQYLSLGGANSGGINSLQGCKLKYLSMKQYQENILSTLFNANVTVETLIIDGIAASAFPLLPEGVNTVRVPSADAAAYAAKFTSVAVVPFNVINVAEGNENKFCSFVAGEKLDFTGVTDVEAYTATSAAISAMDGKLELTPVTGEVKKNTPLFLLPKKSGKIEIPVASNTLQGSDDEYLSSAESLIGGNAAVSRYVEEGEHIWAISAADRKLHPIKAGTVLAPGVAYVKVQGNPSSAMSVISLEIAGETAITSPLQISTEGEVTEHYNISGARISVDAPGIHILSNGRKEIRR